MISLPEAVAALESVGARINLVFHDVTESRDPSRSRYTISLDQFDAIVDWLGRSGLARFCRLYFDDNYPSFHQLVVDRADLPGFYETVLAVPAVNVLAADGCGNWRDLDHARELGVTIAAHGYQHVRLASYMNGALLETPLGGRYQAVASTRGPERVLNENEVLYQLVEAYEVLARFEPREFVLPYGCFNRTTSALNERLGLYETLATADFDLDVGQALRPRLLIEGSTTAEALEGALLRRIEGAT